MQAVQATNIGQTAAYMPAALRTVYSSRDTGPRITDCLRKMPTGLQPVYLLN